MKAPHLPQIDEIRRLGGEGRFKEAQEAAETVLQVRLGYIRAVLALAEIHYLQQNYERALELIRLAESRGSAYEGLDKLRAGLIQLQDTEGAANQSTFVTASMAELLARQGYRWDALRIYRKLYLNAVSKDDFWERILSLRRDLEDPLTQRPNVADDEMALLDRWIEKQRSQLQWQRKEKS
jgi:hypothetical protein